MFLRCHEFGLPLDSVNSVIHGFSGWDGVLGMSLRVEFECVLEIDLDWLSRPLNVIFMFWWSLAGPSDVLFLFWSSYSFLADVEQIRTELCF